jgi:hypothetical protein
MVLAVEVSTSKLISIVTPSRSEHMLPQPGSGCSFYIVCSAEEDMFCAVYFVCGFYHVLAIGKRKCKFKGKLKRKHSCVCISYCEISL